MIVSDVFRDQLIAAIPSLRAFAVSLSGNATRADDLVQETLVKAWDESFELRARHQSARLALHHPAQRHSIPQTESKLARDGG